MKTGTRRGELAFWLGAASIVGWWAAVSWLVSEWIVDEQFHVPTSRWLAGTGPAPEKTVPMLPAAHLVFASVARLIGDHLVVLRGVNVALSIITLRVVLALLRRHKPETAAAGTLLFAWNPLLFPFTALVYTEPVTILALVVALYLHLADRPRASAAALGGACLLRQSSIVWVVFFAACELDRVWRGRTGMSGDRRAAGTLWRRALRRTWLHGFVGLVLAGAVLLGGGLVRGQLDVNRPALNPAQFHLFALIVAVLWLPLWLGRAPEVWRSLIRPHVGRATAWAAFVGLAALLAVTYRNPNYWNNFPDYPRNAVLMAIERTAPLRVLSGFVVALTAVIVAGFVAQQSNRRKLGLLWAFTLLYLAPHFLVDPRYVIVPIVYFNLMVRYERREAWALVAWYAGLCVYPVWLALARGSLEAGVL